MFHFVFVIYVVPYLFNGIFSGNAFKLYSIMKNFIFSTFLLLSFIKLFVLMLLRFQTTVFSWWVWISVSSESWLSFFSLMILTNIYEKTFPKNIFVGELDLIYLKTVSLLILLNIYWLKKIYHGGRVCKSFRGK